MDDPIDKGLAYGTLALVLGLVLWLIWIVIADRPPSRPMATKHIGSHR